MSDERDTALDTASVVAAEIAARLHGRTIATAESCTAGRIAEALATVPGAVEFLAGGLVSYQVRVKRDLLGVTAASVMSAACAEQMAVGVCRLLGTDIGVSTTGVAGDDPVDGVQPGTVFIGVAVSGSVTSREHHLNGDPEAVCEQARVQALRDLFERISSRNDVTTAAVSAGASTNGT